MGIRKVKAGLHISRKDRKRRLENMFLSFPAIWLCLYIVEMITGIDLSQQIFAIDMLTALKSSLAISLGAVFYRGSKFQFCYLPLLEKV